MLGSVEIAVDKAEKNPYLYGTYILVCGGECGEINNKQVDKNKILVESDKAMT